MLHQRIQTLREVQTDTNILKDLTTTREVDTAKPSKEDVEPAMVTDELVKIEVTSRPVSRQSSIDLLELQQPDDSSDVSDYSKQISASSDTDSIELSKQMTSILDSIVLEAESISEGQI